MRKFAIMTVCGLGLMLASSQQSEAGHLFGWLFHHGCGQQACCYPPPQTCCYPPPTTCGYAPSGCSSCSSYGGGHAAPGYSSPCGPGGCGSTSVPLPATTVYAPVPMQRPLFGFFAPRPAPVAFRMPMRTSQPVAQSAPTAKKERTNDVSATNTGWEPVATVR